MITLADRVRTLVPPFVVLVLFVLGGWLIIAARTPASNADAPSEDGAGPPARAAEVLTDPARVDPALARQVLAVTQNDAGWLLVVTSPGTTTEHAGDLCAALEQSGALSAGFIMVVDHRHRLVQAC
ncbi:hypothetical protein [Nocardioides stalactiti]|uniref:hypothetical protein n=1 Tax=Nocardioides stalactiti TaxID=2755356 RepID=UPI001602E708|nr:hypothetical protein [Nocardioides stalactiti]